MKEADWQNQVDLKDPLVSDFLDEMAEVYQDILEKYGEEEARFFLAGTCGPVFGNALRHIEKRLGK